MRNRNVVIVFAKAARICRVKTRLWPTLTHRQCLYLHKRVSNQILQRLKRQQKNYRLLLYTTSREPAFAMQNRLQIKLQMGNNLGSRMLHAISTELENANRVVLIGSDCLEINIDYIEQALAKIHSPRDVVLGPATDGGYVLIGMSRAHAGIFQHVAWGSTKVLQQTIANANAARLNVKIIAGVGRCR